MKSIKTNVIILRRTNFQEADRIMTVITPEHGKLRVMARGVRREKSKLAGGIELLATSNVTLHQGKGELLTLTSARLEKFYGKILQDYDRLQFAYYALKDIDRAAEMVPEPEFYTLLEETLKALNDESIRLGVTMLWYRLQMAILLGVGVNLSTDREGDRLVSDEKYRYVPSESVFVLDGRGAFTADHIKLLRIASAQPPQVINKVSGIQSLLDDCLDVAHAAHE